MGLSCVNPRAARSLECLVEAPALHRHVAWGNLSSIGGGETAVSEPIHVLGHVFWRLQQSSIVRHPVPGIGFTREIEAPHTACGGLIPR